MRWREGKPKEGKPREGKREIRRGGFREEVARGGRERGPYLIKVPFQS
jgi:hypothetical protein